MNDITQLSTLYSNAIARAEKAEEALRKSEWQPIDTAPKDGKSLDLWGIDHLHPQKTGRRATNVTWGPVLDWMGRERDDWRHGRGEDFEPTHWRPLPSPPPVMATTQAETAS